MSVEPKAWLYEGPDGEDYVRTHRDVSHGWMTKNGWKETPLFPPAILDAEVEDILYHIKRSAELSADIMRNPERTGEWVGAERTARAFDRLAEYARNAKAMVNIRRRVK